MAEEAKTIKQLEGLPEEVKEIEKNPILKPLIDYTKIANMLAHEDESESEFLTKKLNELDKLLDTGIYDDSMIANKYKTVTEIYQRILLIMARYTQMADEKVVEMKKIVEKYYIPKTEHESILNEQLEISQGLKDKLNSLQEKSDKDESPEEEPKDDDEEDENISELFSGEN